MYRIWWGQVVVWFLGVSPGFCPIQKNWFGVAVEQSSFCAIAEVFASPNWSQSGKSLMHFVGHSLKVSASPKLIVLHNFGFLYDSINIRNSFRLKKKSTKKCYSYGKLLNKNNSAILIILINCWQLFSSHSCVFMLHKLTQFTILETLKVVVLWNLWMSSKKKKKLCPFSSSKPRPKKGGLCWNKER